MAHKTRGISQHSYAFDAKARSPMGARCLSRLAVRRKQWPTNRRRS